MAEKPVLPTLDGSSLTEMGVYDSPIGPIKFFGCGDSPLLETEEWRLFVAELPSPKGQLGLLKIATAPEHNGVLGWEGYVLTIMQSIADDLDAEAEAANALPPYYGALFPKVVQRIDIEDGRMALVLAYHPSISGYKELKPLSLIPENKRLDLKTIMWILGKSLKLATLFHSAGFSIGKLTSDNVFITQDNLDVHGVFYFDLSYSDQVMIVNSELSEMARTAWFAAGGTDEKEPPHDADIMTADQHAKFVANLFRMMNGVELGTAQEEMDRLYELNDEIWPKVPIKDGPNSRGQTHKRQWHVFRLLDK